MATRNRRRAERVNYHALNRLSSADLDFSFKVKRKFRPGSKVYEVERIISKRTSSAKDTEYLVKWKNWPIWTCSWEPSSHLTQTLIRGFNNPVVTPERLQHGAATFFEGILGILRSRAVKAVHTVDIRLDHDIVRYVFRDCGKLAADNKSILYQKSDFDRFCLPPYWYYSLNEHGQGIAVDFPIKLRVILSFTRTDYVMICGKLQKAPTSPMEKIFITVNRRACDHHNF